MKKFCTCNLNKEDYIPEEKYSLFGLIMLSVFGITPKSKKIILKCKKCNLIIKKSI